MIKGVHPRHRDTSRSVYSCHSSVIHSEIGIRMEIEQYQQCLKNLVRVERLLKEDLAKMKGNQQPDILSKAHYEALRLICSEMNRTSSMIRQTYIRYQYTW